MRLNRIGHYVAISGAGVTLAAISVLFLNDPFGPGSAIYRITDALEDKAPYAVLGLLVWISGSTILMYSASAGTCKRWAIGSLVASCFGWALMPFAKVYGSAGFIMLSALLCLPLSLSFGIAARMKRVRWTP